MGSLFASGGSPRNSSFARTGPYETVGTPFVRRPRLLILFSPSSPITVAGPFSVATLPTPTTAFSVSLYLTTLPKMSLKLPVF